MPLDSISVTQLISAPFMKVVSETVGIVGGGTGSTIGPSTLGLQAMNTIATKQTNNFTNTFRIFMIRGLGVLGSKD
jgi:hypothetical protein